MPTLLDSYAIENSTFAIGAAFTDDAGDDVIPSAITWTLCDAAANIINSLKDETVDTPAASITIVLSGADLQILDEKNASEIRYLEISAVYDSSLGSDLPLKDRAEFKVINLKSIKT